MSSSNSLLISLSFFLCESSELLDAIIYEAVPINADDTPIIAQNSPVVNAIGIKAAGPIY